jgi:ribose transport system permease protein
MDITKPREPMLTEPTTEPSARRPRSGWLSTVLTKAPVHELGLAIAVILFGAYFASANDAFLSLENIGNILDQITFLGILVVGMTFVVISGQFDLSVGSMYGLVAVVFAVLLRDGMSMPAAIALGVLTGAGLGLVNGCLVVGLRVPAIIVTLGTLSIYRGIDYAISGTFPISEFDKAGALFSFTQNGLPAPLGWFPQLFIALVVVGLAGHLLLTRTSFGQHVCAQGSNQVAAVRAGIRIHRVQILVLTLMGACAGIAAILSVGQAGTADPNAGNGFELQAIAAVIIGGAALNGGRGTVIASLLGILLIGEVQNGLILSGVQLYGQIIFSGALIIVAVAIDRLLIRREGGFGAFLQELRRLRVRGEG